MKWKEIIIVIAALLVISLVVNSFGIWDNTKPADSDAIYGWPASIRTNWDALEAAFGVDLTDAATGTVPTFNVKNPTYGAIGDGSTDDSTAIQAAIDACFAAGGGTTILPEGTYTIDTTLVLPSLVHLVGQGRSVTILKLKDNADSTVIKSLNFDTLKDSDASTVALGCNYRFGLHRLTIDGNKANNASGYGVQFYGKNYIVRDVFIRNAKEDGFYTESGSGPSGTGDLDTIEACIGPLWVKSCDGNGITMRGPHDAYFDQIWTLLNGGIGFVVQTSADYEGGCEIGFLHSYANTGQGVRIESGIYASQIEAEANYAAGIYFDTAANIGTLNAYANNRAEGNVDTNAQVVVNSGDVHISNLSCSDFDYHATGLIVNNGKVIIGHVYMSGGGTTATAIKMDASYSHIGGGYIAGFSGAGGVGLESNVSGSKIYNNISLTITNCKTLWINSNTGLVNNYTILGRALTGQTVFSGSAMTVSERVSLSCKDDDTTYIYNIPQTNATLADEATPSVMASVTNIWETGGTTNITDLDDHNEGEIITILCLHSLTFDFTTAQDADHNLDGSSADITVDTGDILVFLSVDGTKLQLISNNDASADNN